MNQEAIGIDELVAANPLLVTKIARALMCGPTEAHQALAEVLKFLRLAASEGVDKLTPSHRVDLAWHEFILFTRTYGDFCNRFFAKMIHHEPGGDSAAYAAQYALTVRAYEAQFGPPPPKFWNSPGNTWSSCGACESTWNPNDVHVRNDVD